MKKLLTLLFAFCTIWVQAQNFPEKSNRLVNDYTATLSPEETNSLEQKLRLFADSTSTQIAVVLINSTEGYDISEYAAQLGEKWGVGQKDKNNGVMLLAALNDRKVTIQVGYGLEGAIPDVICHQIIKDLIRPNFKQGDYFSGLDEATDALINASKGEYKATPKNKHSNGWSGLIVIGVILLIAIFSRLASRRTHVIGGAGASDLLWWTMMMNSGGGRSGGFGGGGGSDFGGFGGGSFGGGGSSGGW